MKASDPAAFTSVVLPQYGAQFFCRYFTLMAVINETEYRSVRWSKLAVQAGGAWARGRAASWGRARDRPEDHASPVGFVH